MSKNPRIFLSHSSKDKLLAEELANQIRGFLGFAQSEVFVSSEPEGIDIGVDWFQSVITALEKSEAFVILITPNSMPSNWVWFEIGYFWKVNKFVIYPLYTPSSNIPHPLNTLQAKLITDKRQFSVFIDRLRQKFDFYEDVSVDYDRLETLVYELSMSEINTSSNRRNLSDFEVQRIIEQNLERLLLETARIFIPRAKVFRNIQPEDTKHALMILAEAQNHINLQTLENIFTGKLIEFSEVDTMWNLPSGSAKKFLITSAGNFNLSVYRSFENSLEFRLSLDYIEVDNARI